MVSSNTEPCPRPHHAHHYPHDTWTVSPSVNQVSKEDQRSASGITDCRPPAVSRNAMNVICQRSEQLHEFIEAPRNMADDVERRVRVAEVRPERLPLELHRLLLLRRVEHIDVAKTF